MKENELLMYMREWLRYFDKNHEMMKSRYNSICLDWDKNIWNYCYSIDSLRDTSTTVPPKMPKKLAKNKDADLIIINGMGLFNFDILYPMLNAPLINAIFKKQNGEIIKPKAMFMLIKEINGQIVCYPKQFKINPNVLTSFFLIDKENRRYYVYSKQTKSFNYITGNTYTFIVDDVTDKTTNIENLKLLLSE